MFFCCPFKNNYFSDKNVYSSQKLFCMHGTVRNYSSLNEFFQLFYGLNTILFAKWLYGLKMMRMAKTVEYYYPQTCAKAWQKPCRQFTKSLWGYVGFGSFIHFCHFYYFLHFTILTAGRIKQIKTQIAMAYFLILMQPHKST